MDNVEFRYLYRDGGNNKAWGGVTFSNPERLAADFIDRELRRFLEPEGLFLAGQIRVLEVFLFAKGRVSFDDHCYHEFAAVTSSAEFANDAYGRSISEFLIEVTREAERGWQEFDPYDSKGSYGWLLASRTS